MIEITAGLAIPEQELQFSYSRSGGPGGQHVNKVATRVTLRFDVRNSPSLTDEQKQRILERLPTRIDGQGVLRVTSSASRSQLANREKTVERFAQLLREALAEDAPRRPTRPTAASRRRRADDKERRSRIKRDRSWRPTD
ncbi:MAG: aminoacyl-tRNA hydrolase [Acidobacteria bacterium]|nr:aminoacyl-tRNA hydrolase [Acidobacteriota bacterium]